MGVTESTDKGSSYSSQESRGRTAVQENKEESSSPLPSPGSGNVDRGRSRVRRPSNTSPEEALRMRCGPHIHNITKHIPLTSFASRVLVLAYATRFLRQRISYIAFIVRQGFSCREAMETRSRDGLWSIWGRRVRNTRHYLTTRA
jgi:hypothetical protein